LAAAIKNAQRIGWQVDGVVVCKILKLRKHHRSSCQPYVFYGLEDVTPGDADLGGAEGSSSRKWHLSGRVVASVTIPADFYVLRAKAWAAASEKYGWDSQVLDGGDRLGDQIRDTLAAVHVPNNFVAIAKKEEARASMLRPEKPRKYAAIARKIQEGLGDRVAMTRSRCYHALTGCPRDLRQYLNIEFLGRLEPLVGVDLHACYYLALVSEMPDCLEKDVLAILLKRRMFFDRIAVEAGFDTDTSGGRASFKVALAREFLFVKNRGWPLDKRPVAAAVHKMFPIFASTVLDLQRTRTAGELSDWLCAVESRIVLDRVMLWCRDSEIPALPLHDAVYCPASSAAKVREMLIEAGKSVLGFAPGVRIEHPHLGTV